MFVPTLLPLSFHWYDGAAPPFVGVAVNVILVPAQIILSASFDEILTLAGRLALTVVVMPEDVAGEPVTQLALDVSTTVTISPFAREAFVYVAMFVPTLVPLRFHWYDGAAPPFVGVAVNVTLVPAQTMLSASLDAMLTLAGRLALTVVVMPEDVAGEPVTQLALDVITTVTISLFAREAFV